MLGTHFQILMKVKDRIKQYPHLPKSGWIYFSCSTTKRIESQHIYAAKDSCKYQTLAFTAHERNTKDSDTRRDQTEARDFVAANLVDPNNCDDVAGKIAQGTDESWHVDAWIDVTASVCGWVQLEIVDIAGRASRDTHAPEKLWQPHPQSIVAEVQSEVDWQH